MNGKLIGEQLAAAVGPVEGVANIRGGGNLGMAFIAAAIEDHASAVRCVADGLGRVVSELAHSRMQRESCVVPSGPKPRRAVVVYVARADEGQPWRESEHPVLVHEVCGAFAVVEALDLIATYQMTQAWMITAQRGQVLKVPADAVRFVDFQ